MEGIPRRLVWLGAAAYLAVLLALTLSPAPPDDPENRDPLWLNLRPFDTIGRSLGGQMGPAGVALLFGNVAAFVPLGVLVPLLGRPSWRAVAAAGIGLSAAIETTELSLSLLAGRPYRHADVDDVILNGSGALLGYLGLLLLRGLLPGAERETRAG